VSFAWISIAGARLYRVVTPVVKDVNLSKYLKSSVDYKCDVISIKMQMNLPPLCSFQ
jgi:hypothetical protein